MIRLGPGQADRRLDAIETADILFLFGKRLSLGIVLNIGDIKARENIGIERQYAFRLIKFVNCLNGRAKGHLRSGHHIVLIYRLVLDPF